VTEQVDCHVVTAVVQCDEPRQRRRLARIDERPFQCQNYRATLTLPDPSRKLRLGVPDVLQFRSGEPFPLHVGWRRRVAMYSTIDDRWPVDGGGSGRMEVGHEMHRRFLVLKVERRAVDTTCHRPVQHNIAPW
jgi:hypothetical protein